MTSGSMDLIFATVSTGMDIGPTFTNAGPFILTELNPSGAVDLGYVLGGL
jgi:hypothetical protein